MKQVKSHRPIKLNIDYSSREELQEFALNSEFNQFILENTLEPLKYAINKNKTQCILFVVGDGDYKVIVKKNQYKTILDRAIEYFENKEDYNKCNELVKLKEKIK